MAFPQSKIPENITRKEIFLNTNFTDLWINFLCDKLRKLLLKYYLNLSVSKPAKERRIDIGYGGKIA